MSLSNKLTFIVLMIKRILFINEMEMEKTVENIHGKNYFYYNGDSERQFFLYYYHSIKESKEQALGEKEFRMEHKISESLIMFLYIILSQSREVVDQN